MDIELWGGVECTFNRVGDRYSCQIERSGHDRRDDDLERFASLGIRTIRYPVLWERIAPDGTHRADWRWPDRRLPALRALGLTPIVGLVHHGSGVATSHLLDDSFAANVAAFAGAVAARYPWIKDWTPINEPLTTARFAALYGLWFPHARDDRAFVRALLNQCRATVLSMAAIRHVNPRARLVQTDDLGRTRGTEPLVDTVDFYNERRWLAWDLICGTVDAYHPLREYLIENGARPDELDALVEHPCPPDILGVNYYVTSDRWIDHRIERYPDRPCSEGDLPFVDIESVRVLAAPCPSIDALLLEAWQRYRLPLAVTEAHIDAPREDQLRWLADIWHGAQSALAAGADVRAVTAWSLLGAYDWNSLLCERRDYYEAGAFDARAPVPRATALAAMIRELAAGRPPSHPVLHGDGWWRRPERFVAEAVPGGDVISTLTRYRPRVPARSASPVLISGATGTLGRAFASACRQRNLAFVLLDRQAMDIADRASVAAALARYRPWAIVNASGYVRIDEAESDAERCWRENVVGPAVLAELCAADDIGLLTFSSDQVFDGADPGRRLESSPTGPRNVYGRSKAEAERRLLGLHPRAMVVRTSAFFGPDDRHNFLVHALDALADGQPFAAARDVFVSPTYVPDLVGVCLDLLVDRESGIWHLANDGAVSWSEFAAQAASCAGIECEALNALPASAMGFVAERPTHCALASERAFLMPTLQSAIERFLAATADRRFGSRAAKAPPAEARARALP